MSFTDNKSGALFLRELGIFANIASSVRIQYAELLSIPGDVPKVSSFHFSLVDAFVYHSNLADIYHVYILRLVQSVFNNLLGVFGKKSLFWRLFS